jgi:cation diffusion facilitator family transporter
MQEGSKKAIVAAFLANLGIAIAKTVGFVITRSAGLLAEAGHSIADTGNQALLILGGRRAARQADREHPFGFGRERYFWAFVVALVLFSMGGLFALYEGIDKLRHPHETENLLIAVGILVIAIGLETFSLLTAIREARRVKPGGTSWWEFLHHAKSPELPVVLLEDLGAEIGLVMALAGVLLAQVTHDARWDAAGSIGIGALLVVLALFLAIEMKGLLIGEAATPETERVIIGAIESNPQVRSLIHLKTQHLGPDELLVGAKIDFAHDLDIRGLAAAVDQVEAAIRQAVPAARTIYLEPDLRRPPE